MPSKKNTAKRSESPNHIYTSGQYVLVYETTEENSFTIAMVIFELI